MIPNWRLHNSKEYPGGLGLSLPQACVFGFLPNGLGTMALGKKVKMGERLSGKLCVLRVSSEAGGELGLSIYVFSESSVRESV
jgi:hypothetical protein